MTRIQMLNQIKSNSGVNISVILNLFLFSCTCTAFRYALEMDQFSPLTQLQTAIIYFILHLNNHSFSLYEI
ncbi:hypothetical protein X975_09446, partial [Stegodyphus mimosarum]